MRATSPPTYIASPTTRWSNDRSAPRRRPPPLAHSEARLMGRLVLIVLPALSLVGALFYITVFAPYLLPRSSYPTNPPQPVFFDHQVHVQQVGLQCEFCHRTA